jgi:hypothetical protein
MDLAPTYYLVICMVPTYNLPDTYYNLLGTYVMYPVPTHYLVIYMAPTCNLYDTYIQFTWYLRDVSGTYVLPGNLHGAYV